MLVSLEVIVIDNGSTDASAATAAEFANRLPDFNCCGGDAREVTSAQHGHRCARGSHLIFVDADDEADEEYVERCRGLEQYDVVGGFIDTTT